MTNAYKSAPSAAALMIMRDLRLRLDTSKSRNFGPFDLVLQRGDLVAILGPSGAGKSTLLKAMAGDSRVAVSCGSVVLQGLALNLQVEIIRLKVLAYRYIEGYYVEKHHD